MKKIHDILITKPMAEDLVYGFLALLLQAFLNAGLLCLFI